MTTKSRLGWRKLFLILTVLPCCRNVEVSIPVAQYEVARGADITMTCNFVPARPVSGLFFLSWEAFPLNEGEGTMQNVGTFYINGQIDIAPGYEGRAFLEVDMDRQLSTLRLTKVTMQDSRRYECSVKIQGDDEGTPSASTSLLVLVPPSKPICEIQGSAEYWQDITLTCRSEEGSPQPVYQWTTFSVENRPRAFPPKANQKDGLLSLFNISRETSGFFICTSENRIGSAHCNLTLAVVPRSMNVASTAGIIGGVIAGVVVLGIVIFCCCRKRGKKNDENVENSPGEFYDDDGPKAGEPYRDEPNEMKDLNQDKPIVAQKEYTVVTANHFEDDQHSYNSGRERHDGKGSDIDSQRYRDGIVKDDYYRGSRDKLEDQCDRYGGSRDRLEDQRDRYGGSRDRLEDQRDRYGGSRDRLEDQRDRYGGSRDRLEDHRDRYGGSRDRLEDQRDRYGGSRDRLEDQRDRYGGSRDRYGGSREHLDEHSDRHRSSRDHIEYIDQY
ncbi:A33 antigen Glycoprotein [Collichthys lucidus]|uniref:A33 antigen Glycoprotein n=1 Tax=Collichthys lucidus TaxID=240159 RepID=A0A4U5U0Y9_COLLU|nr:A33 antigen Glycoprotein [Collichthys lucidus]